MKLTKQPDELEKVCSTLASVANLEALFNIASQLAIIGSIQPQISHLTKVCVLLL